MKELNITACFKFRYNSSCCFYGGESIITSIVPVSGRYAKIKFGTVMKEILKWNKLVSSFCSIKIF